jgi:hypothetical protein
MLDHFQTSIMLFGMMIIATLIVLTSVMVNYKKVLVMAIMIGCSVLTYRAFNSFYGQPKIYELSDTEKTKLIGFYIDKKSDAIYLWMKKSTDPSPLSYRVLYTKKLAKTLRALQSRYKGQPSDIEINGKFKPLNPTGQDTEIDIKDLPKVLNLKKEY